jgi:hypothetical protein
MLKLTTAEKQKIKAWLNLLKIYYNLLKLTEVFKCIEKQLL